MPKQNQVISQLQKNFKTLEEDYTKIFESSSDNLTLANEIAHLQKYAKITEKHRAHIEFMKSNSRELTNALHKKVVKKAIDDSFIYYADLLQFQALVIYASDRRFSEYVDFLAYSQFAPCKKMLGKVKSAVRLLEECQSIFKNSDGLEKAIANHQRVISVLYENYKNVYIEMIEREYTGNNNPTLLDEYYKNALKYAELSYKHIEVHGDSEAKESIASSIVDIYSSFAQYISEQVITYDQEDERQSVLDYAIDYQAKAITILDKSTAQDEALSRQLRRDLITYQYDRCFTYNQSQIVDPKFGKFKKAFREIEGSDADNDLEFLAMKIHVYVMSKFYRMNQLEQLCRQFIDLYVQDDKPDIKRSALYSSVINYAKANFGMVLPEKKDEEQTGVLQQQLEHEQSLYQELQEKRDIFSSRENYHQFRLYLNVSLQNYSIAESGILLPSLKSIINHIRIGYIEDEISQASSTNLSKEKMRFLLEEIKSVEMTEDKPYARIHAWLKRLKCCAPMALVKKEKDKLAAFFQKSQNDEEISEEEFIEIKYILILANTSNHLRDIYNFILICNDRFGAVAGFSLQEHFLDSNARKNKQWYVANIQRMKAELCFWFEDDTKADHLIYLFITKLDEHYTKPLHAIKFIREYYENEHKDGVASTALNKSYNRFKKHLLKTPSYSLKRHLLDDSPVVCKKQIISNIEDALCDEYQVGDTDSSGQSPGIEESCTPLEVISFADLMKKLETYESITDKVMTLAEYCKLLHTPEEWQANVLTNLQEIILSLYKTTVDNLHDMSAEQVVVIKRCHDTFYDYMCASKLAANSMYDFIIFARKINDIATEIPNEGEAFTFI